MAQIPDYTALGPRPVPTPSYRRVMVDDSGARVEQAVAGVGGALTDVGNALYTKARADAATWASNQLTDFRVQTQQAMQDAQTSATDDAHGFTPGVLADFDKRASTLTGVAESNPLAAQFIQRAIPDLRAQVQENAMRWESNQRTAYRTQSVLDNTTRLAAIVEGDPSQRLPIGAQLLSQIDAGGFEPTERGKLKDHVVTQLGLASADGAARADPVSALTKLNDPNDRTYESLTLPQREALRTRANEHLADGVYSALATGSYRNAQAALLQNANIMDPKQFDRLQQSINAQQEHQVVMGDKAKRDASDSLLKSAILMEQKGQLTDQWIEQHHNVWEVPAYEYAKALVSGKKADTDTSTYLHLLDRKSNGEDVRDDTLSAAAHGLLDKNDAAKLIEGAGESPPSLYKRGHDFIQTAGQVSQLEPDPAKTQTLANMQNDWNDMFKQNQAEWAKSPQEGEAAYRALVGRYQLVPAERNLLTLPVPRYFQGTRVAPDIQGTQTATWNAYQSKEIDEQEFNRQAYLLQQWRHAADIAAQRKAAAAKAQAEANK